MGKRILLLQGHPDRSQPHFGHALASAYDNAARNAGHELRTIAVAELDFPLLRSQHEWQHEPLPPSLHDAQDAIGWAQHLVLFFPLWLGGMPALLKGFLEQVARPGFALSTPASKGALPAKLLSGRSARVVVTMGMPAAVYRWYFRAHSLKALERNILGFAGIAPIHETLVGNIEGLSDAQRAKWLQKLAEHGRDGH